MSNVWAPGRTTFEFNVQIIPRPCKKTFPKHTVYVFGITYFWLPAECQSEPAANIIRSMFFKDIIGQQSVKERLIKSVGSERISHAQLFSGPEGNGKVALALAYAQYITCLKRSETDSCGVCPACKKYAKLAHPDLHFVFPVFKNKPNQNAYSDDFLNLWREMLLQSPYISLNRWGNTKIGRASCRVTV